MTIMAMLLGLIMFATGHTWVPIITAAIFGLAADLILKSGEYKSAKLSIVGYGVFSIWAMGAMLPIWIMRDSYFSYIRSGMGDEYANTILAMTPEWLAFVVVIVAFAAGIVGAFLGKAVLRKHFEKAGIV